MYEASSEGIIMQKKHFIRSYYAAKTATDCVAIIYSELGIKLSVGTPNFLKKVENCTKLIDSKDLMEAYKDLSVYKSLLHINQQ